LLHQFAAGFLKTANPEHLAALQAILAQDFAVAEPTPEDAAEPLVLALQAEAPPMPQPMADDDIEATDRLDVDLFPIFEEEALELLPQLGGALRQWSAHPTHPGARREALRALHTLKGSARLAGAMRLGEMAHRMESAVEHIGAESATAEQIDPLLGRLDALSDCFDALCATPAAALVLPELASPVQAVEPTLALTEPAVGDLAAVEAVEPAALPVVPAPAPLARRGAGQTTRVKSQLLDRMVNNAGEVMITRSRLESRLLQMRASLADLTGNLERLRHQLRDMELQSESQMQSRLAQTKDAAQGFDPLEFDRFTRVQELTRMMAESVHDVATVQRSLQQTVQGVDDDLFAQARLTRELQRDLLRTRMVDFESIADRLYGVVRQAAKDYDKPVKLDIDGGSLDMDRGVLERVAPAFEHLLRNAVGHGIESAAVRAAAGKPSIGSIHIKVVQQSNDVVVTLRDDGAGLNLPAIRDKAIAQGQISAAQTLSDDELARLIFTSGLSTAAEVTEMAGRGVGMDVVRTEVDALGGRIELSTRPGEGTSFTLVMPLTTAVTQVVLLRMGEVVMGVPSNLVESVRRVPATELDLAYRQQRFDYAGESLPFYWAGALLQLSGVNLEAAGKHAVVAVFRSAGQRVALHVNEVLGNREAVVKNLGPQLSRLPGLAGMTVLASGAVVLIYNPVALAHAYAERARTLTAAALAAAAAPSLATGVGPSAAVAQAPLVLVVDDSITVRRVTQRLLKREGFRVAMAADGLQALEVLQLEKPSVVLTDIEMPRMDGFDLVRNIRSDTNLQDLPVIMITSRIAEKHRDYARALKVDHYLGKPYPEDELITLVRAYCQTHQTGNFGI
jgi:chemosensory pili system protein ChpA (sensor histidine kinase/response regulator)